MAGARSGTRRVVTVHMTELFWTGAGDCRGWTETAALMSMNFAQYLCTEKERPGCAKAIFSQNRAATTGTGERYEIHFEAWKLAAYRSQKPDQQHWAHHKNRARRPLADI